VLVLAGLSTGHKIGLLTMALIFIAFAVVSSFLAPRRWPDFPGKFLSLFVVASFVLFALMIGAVEIFGRESESASAGELAKGAPQKGPIDVTESEWKVVLPPATSLTGGAYTFHVVNKGKQVHNLTINGPGLANVHTPDLASGKSADLKVILKTGTYDLFCSIPGHKQLGMDAKLAVH